MAKSRRDDISIGKFDILATYADAKALLGGLSEAEDRGIVAAILGAEARLGHTGDQAAEKEAAAERKKRRQSPPNRPTVRSPTGCAGSSRTCSFLP